LSIPSKLQRLAKLSLLDWVILLQLVAGTFLLEMLLRLIPLPRLVQVFLWGSITRVGAMFPLLQRQFDAQHVSTLAAFTTRIVRGPEYYLLRSLLLFWLLQMRREPVALVIGVQKDAETLLSHAWVETQEGKVVGGYQNGDAFQPFLAFLAQEYERGRRELSSLRTKCIVVTLPSFVPLRRQSSSFLKG
jgi:hypothetical protein